MCGQAANVSAPFGVELTCLSPIPTLSPTVAPTYTPKEACGDNQWCFSVDINPEVGVALSETLAIANQHEDEDWILNIALNIGSYQCVAPSLSITFEEIDFGTPADEYFDVFISVNDNNTLITRCNGTQQRNCGVWLSCVEDYSLGMISISGILINCVNMYLSFRFGCN